MGTRTVKFCDVDNNHEATDTVTVSLDGDAVELDACDPCAKKIRDGVSRLIKPGRPLAIRELVKLAANGGGDWDPGLVRRWAAAKNVPCNDRGRVPEEVVNQWKAAGSPTTW